MIQLFAGPRFLLFYEFVPVAARDLELAAQACVFFSRMSSRCRRLEICLAVGPTGHTRIYVS